MQLPQFLNDLLVPSSRCFKCAVHNSPVTIASAYTQLEAKSTEDPAANTEGSQCTARQAARHKS